MFIVANIKILGIMLINQLIKGSKEKFFIKQNFRRKYQASSSGQKFFGKKKHFLPKNFSPEKDVWYFRRKFGLIKNFLLPFINWFIKTIYVKRSSLVKLSTAKLFLYLQLQPITWTHGNAWAVSAPRLRSSLTATRQTRRPPLLASLRWPASTQPPLPATSKWRPLPTPPTCRGINYH